MAKKAIKSGQNEAKTSSESTVSLPAVRKVEGQVIRAPIVGPLRDQGGVRRELARVYRAARRGEIPVDEASKLTYCLFHLSKIIESETFEERMDRIEEALGRER